MSANPTLPPPSPEAWRAAGAHFDYRGQRIYYRDSGASAKPALLLIHGFPSASWDWHDLWAPLAERFRLIAPDMIGFGFSAKPRGWGYSIHDQADLHLALCARLGVSEVHVLAHDYGVSVAQELLARHEASLPPPPLAGGDWPGRELTQCQFPLSQSRGGSVVPGSATAPSDAP